MRWLLVCVGLVGCGPDMTEMPDLAPMPMDMTMAGCMPEYGKVFFVDSLRFMPQDEGFDLDGDGKIDNNMGQVGPLANRELANSIKLGTTIMLVDLHGLDPPPLVDGSKPTLSLYLGLDADQPADPSNNANNGAFKVPIEQFDVNCKASTTFDHSVIKNGGFDCDGKKIDIIAGSIGTIRWLDARLTMSPTSADLTKWTGVTGGLGLTCSLSITPFPGPNTASLLDVMVNGLSMQPDIDRDKDGIEKLVGDGNGIKECIDGDGTVIPGRNCPCDPRMQDGYSGALGFTLVPARIVGTVMSQ